MSLDDPFRHTFDQLSARVLEDFSGRLKSIGDELSSTAKEHRARAVAEAWQTGRSEAEQQANQRVAAAEQQIRDAVALADTRVQDAVASVDARIRDAVAAAEAQAATAVAAAQEAAQAAASESIAVAETRTQAQLAFHESRVHEVESRAKEDILAAEARAHDAVNRAEALARETLAGAESRSRDAIAAIEAEMRSRVDAAESRSSEQLAAAASRAAADLDAAVSRERVEAAADAAASHQRLVSAIRALDAGQSLSDIMNTLVRCACAEAPRVGIFVREGASLRGWKLIGFDHLSQDAPLDLSHDNAGIIGDALQSAQVVSSGPAFHAMAPIFAQLPMERSAIAVPLVISGDVIGVLYGDEGSGPQAAPASWSATVEVLGRHATRALEVLTASKLLAQAFASRTPAMARPGGLAGR